MLMRITDILYYNNVHLPAIPAFYVLIDEVFADQAPCLPVRGG